MTKDDTVCEHMKKITLDAVCRSLDALQYEICLDPHVMSRARGVIERGMRA